MTTIGVATVSLLVGLAAPVAAQRPADFVADLCANNVTYEEQAFETGFLTDSDLSALDRVALEAQGADGFFKVVVLGKEVTEADSAEAFASDVLDDLGGEGRVLVFDPEAGAAVSSNVDPSSEAVEAAVVATSTANARQSLAAGAQAAVDTLGATGAPPAQVPTTCTGGGGGSGDSGDSSSGGGGRGGLVILVAVLALGALGVFLFLRSRAKAKAPAGGAGRAPMGEGEIRVRNAVDHASNLVIELSDRVELPGAPAEAVAAFNRGAAAFAELQDDLEEADTRPELEAVYPKLVDMVWQLDTAKALVDGQPAPEKPTPPPLFPPMLPPSSPGGSSLPAPAPEAASDGGYKSFNVSPWITTAAMTAMSVLMSRGFGGSSRHHRPPSDDSWFDGMFGGGGGGGGRGAGPRIDMGGGRGGRGVGRRR